jgi:hypothetical protein
VSETQFPPHETRCADCGCCPATVFAAGVPICLECDAGEPCKGTKKLNATTCNTMQQAAASNEVAKHEAEEEPVTIVSGRKRGKRIPDDVRAQIMAEPDSISHVAVARKYGVTDVTVGVIRGRKGRVTRKTAAPSPVKTAKAATTKVVKIQPPQVKISTPVIGKISISAEVSEAGANAWWQSLTLEQKAATIQMRMLAIFNRTQETPCR